MQGNVYLCNRSEGRRASVVLRREAYQVLFLHDDGTEEWRDVDEVRSWFGPYNWGEPQYQIAGSEEDIRRVFTGCCNVVRQRTEREIRSRPLGQPAAETRTRSIDLG